MRSSPSTRRLSSTRNRTPGLPSIVDGRVVAWAKVWYRPSTEREHRAYLFGGVDPEWRRRGVGTAVFNWQLQRGRQLVTEAEPDLPRAVRTNSWDWLEDAIALYERFGLEPVRYYDVLSRSLAEPIPPKAIDGARLVPWGEVDSERVRQAHNEAFADHWGSTPIPRESWDHMNGESDFRPDLSFVVLADGEVVGYATERRLSRGLGYSSGGKRVGSNSSGSDGPGARGAWPRRCSPPR